MVCTLAGAVKLPCPVDMPWLPCRYGLLFVCSEAKLRVVAHMSRQHSRGRDTWVLADLTSLACRVGQSEPQRDLILSGKGK